MTGKICAFTGHRPASLPFGYDEASPACVQLKQALTDRIVSLITQDGVTCFLSGMALGVDLFAAEIVLGLKEKFPAIELQCAVPCADQAARWCSANRQRHQNILMNSDAAYVLEESYSPGCMQRRNRYMVDRADVILAVWNGRPSGTGSTVRYARKCGKPVVVINPESPNRVD